MNVTQPVPGLQHRTVLLDEAVDALALEVERIGEAVRFKDKRQE